MATFVVAEEEFFQPGVDLAAALSHRGHTVVRLLADSVTDRLQQRWQACATRTVGRAVAADGSLTEAGERALSEVTPVDWQVAEPIAVWLSQQGYEQRLGFRRTAPLPVEDVIDKWRMHEYLRSRGVPVPDTWTDVERVPPGTEGPFLIKVRDGGGGEGIVRVTDLSPVRTQTSQIIQRCYPGPVLDSAGVAVDGELIQVITYRNRVNPRTPYAAAYGITTTHDPALVEYTQRVVSELGITGPFALDAVVGADGQPLVIDVNVRIWGCWTACQALGMDVIGAYEHAVGLGPRPAPVVFEPGRYAPILRRPPLGVVTQAQRVRWLTAETREITRRSRWLGPRWRRAALRDSAGWAARGAPLG